MKIKLLVIVVFTLVVIYSCDTNTERNASLDTELDTISYSLGVSVAENLRNQGLKEINADAFAEGVESFFAEGDLKVTPDLANQLLASYFTNLREEEMAAARQEGEEFLAENKEKEGVEVLESGLQYQVMEEGTGPVPDSTDQVRVHYTLKTIEGDTIESSLVNGQPATFTVNQVIPGWTQALTMMETGAKWRLFIPSSLAYGERGAGPQIPPNTTLVFDVELLEIVEEN